MKRYPVSFALGTTVVFLIMVEPRLAFGYINPGTGHLILQGIASAVVGAMFYFHVGWRFLKRVFKKFRGQTEITAPTTTMREPEVKA